MVPVNAGRFAGSVRVVTTDLPNRLYEPVLITKDGEGILFQAGAFRTHADAQAVLEIWRSEGRTEEMAVNVVTVWK